MRKSVFRLTALLALVLLISVVPALAHEGRAVGDYELHFGWRVEPVYAGMMNGPELFIGPAQADGAGSDEETTIDTSGMDVNLQVEVSFGDQTMSLTFWPAEGDTGHYIADLVPMLPGDYSFHLTGNIGDMAVDEVFTSADGQFGTVEPASDIMFPALPQVDNARIDALEARIAALEEQMAALQGS